MSRRIDARGRRLRGPLWADARTYIAFLDTNSHHVEAARRFPWAEVLPSAGEATVLDLACGVGWLTGMLSAREDVRRVIAWDGSIRLVSDLLPDAVELMGGAGEKVEPVCGDFTPLLLDDDDIDLVVLVSAFHHCGEPDELLRELHRVVRPTGAIVLLNEVPFPVTSMGRWIATTAIAATVNAVVPGPGLRKRGHLAADHALYDPELGDRAMTRVQWRRLLDRHAFDVQTVDSGLAPYRPSFRSSGWHRSRLTHFVLRPR